MFFLHVSTSTKLSSGTIIIRHTSRFCQRCEASLTESAVFVCLCTVYTTLLVTFRSRNIEEHKWQMFILYMKHPRLCNTRMCIEATSHTQLTLFYVHKGLKMTYTRGRNYLPDNKQTSSKHAPDPLITRELHKKPVYVLPLTILIIIYNRKVVNIYTGRHTRNGPNFGRVFLMLNYTDITQNTYVQSWTVSEIMASEVWNFDSCYTLTDYQIHIETGRNMWFL